MFLKEPPCLWGRLCQEGGEARAWRMCVLPATVSWSVGSLPMVVAPSTVKVDLKSAGESACGYKDQCRVMCAGERVAVRVAPRPNVIPCRVCRGAMTY